MKNFGFKKCFCYPFCDNPGEITIFISAGGQISDEIWPSRFFIKSIFSVTRLPIFFCRNKSNFVVQKQILGSMKPKVIKKSTFKILEIRKLYQNGCQFLIKLSQNYFLKIRNICLEILCFNFVIKDIIISIFCFFQIFSRIWVILVEGSVSQEFSLLLSPK